MLIIELIKHDFRRSIRATSGWVKVLLLAYAGLQFLALAFLLVLCGLFLGDMLMESNNFFSGGFKGTVGAMNPLQQVCGSLLYTMSLGLGVRFFVQQLYAFNLSTYQTLNIRRRLLTNFIVLRPLLQPYGYLTLFMIVPFAIRYVSVYYGVVEAFALVWVYGCVITFNSLFSVYLKRRFSSSFWGGLVCLLLVGLFVAMEYFGLFSFFSLSATVFVFLVEHLPVSLFLVVLPLLAFVLNKRFFRQNYYAETFARQQSAHDLMSNFTFFDRWGIEGELLRLRLKLIFRHKRTRTMLWMQVAFLLYGLLFYFSENYQNSYGWQMFCALMITGAGMITFGQIMISCDGAFFDGLMTKSVSIRKYIRSYYLLFMAFGVISFALSSPYMFLGLKYVKLHMVAFVFNMGVSMFLMLATAAYNTQRIDLSHNGATTQKSFSLKGLLVLLPIQAFPVAVMAIAGAFGAPDVGFVILVSVGVLSACLAPLWLRGSERLLNARKYTLAAAFRESEF